MRSHGPLLCAFCLCFHFKPCDLVGGLWQCCSQDAMVNVMRRRAAFTHNNINRIVVSTQYCTSSTSLATAMSKIVSVITSQPLTLHFIGKGMLSRKAHQYYCTYPVTASDENSKKVIQQNVVDSSWLWPCRRCCRRVVVCGGSSLW